MKSTIVVTGGSGFIGTHFVDRLRHSGQFDIVNLDINPPKKAEHYPHWVNCNIMELPALRRILSEARPRYLVHLAARTDTDGKVLDDYAVNSMGTQHVVDSVRGPGSIERAVFVSTQFVVGPGPLPQHDEDFRPHTIYGASKVLAEKAVRNGNLPIVWTIVRPTNVWGSWHPRYPREFWKVMDKGLYFHPGSKPVIRSYGYVGNVASQILAILSKPADQVDRKVVYVGDPPVRLLDWVDEFAVQLTGRRARVAPEPVISALALLGDGLATIGIKFPIFSSRLRSMTQDYPTPMGPTFELLGPPETSLEQGVKQTVEWLRSREGFSSSTSCSSS